MAGRPSEGSLCASEDDGEGSGMTKRTSGVVEARESARLQIVLLEDTSPKAAIYQYLAMISIWVLV